MNGYIFEDPFYTNFVSLIQRALFTASLNWHQSTRAWDTVIMMTGGKFKGESEHLGEDWIWKLESWKKS
jgi:hypothetical protein